ncbi:unannotated protein [freshwater metagenome]|uniref:Unannotated protein n=1 Tax=freshwater metagenome TaxID=449393 RepID=A0A6J6R388_9ZZZZ
MGLPMLWIGPVTTASVGSEVALPDVLPGALAVTSTVIFLPSCAAVRV